MSEIFWGASDQDFNRKKRKRTDDSYFITKRAKNGENDSDEIEIDENLFDFLEKLKHNQQNSFGHNDSIRVVDNNIYYYAGVNNKNILDLILKLRNLANTLLKHAVESSTKPPNIYLHINSPGGSLHAVRAAIDAISECPVPVVTIVEGSAASAGTIMSVMGSRRYIKPNAVMLIHQLSAGFWGKMEEIKDAFKNIKQAMEWIRNFYGKHANIPKAKLRTLLQHDLELSAEQCLEYGLVDEIGDPTIGFINFNKKNNQEDVEME